MTFFMSDSDFDDLPHALRQPRDGLREQDNEEDVVEDLHKGLRAQWRSDRLAAQSLLARAPRLGRVHSQGRPRHGDVVPRALPGVRRAYHPFEDHRSWCLQCAKGASEDCLRLW